MCYYFDGTIKTEDFDFDILIDEKSHKYILLYNISNKTLIGAKPWMNISESMMELARYVVSRYISWKLWCSLQ